MPRLHHRLPLVMSFVIICLPLLAAYTVFTSERLSQGIGDRLVAGPASSLVLGRVDECTILDFASAPNGNHTDGTLVIEQMQSGGYLASAAHGWRQSSDDGSDQRAEWVLNEPVDISDPYIEWWVRVDRPENIGSVNIYLGVDAQFSRYFHISDTMLGDGYRQGWNHISVRKTAFYYANGASAEDWASVRSVMVRARSKPGASLTVTWDSISSYGRRPQCVITFDDGSLTDYTVAKPILDSYGFRSTHFIIPGSIGRDECMTEEQLAQMYAEGFDIANHTFHHTNLTSLSQSRAEREIRDAVEWLEARGFYRSSRLLAYPYGAFNDGVVSLARKWSVLARRSYGNLEDVEAMDMYRVKCFPVRSSHSADDLKAAIDEAIAEQEVVIFLFHTLLDPPDWWSTTPSVFKDTVDYLALRREDIDVIPLSKLAYGL